MSDSASYDSTDVGGYKKNMPATYQKPQRQYYENSNVYSKVMKELEEIKSVVSYLKHRPIAPRYLRGNPGDLYTGIERDIRYLKFKSPKLPFCAWILLFMILTLQGSILGGLIALYGK